MGMNKEKTVYLCHIKLQGLLNNIISSILYSLFALITFNLFVLMLNGN